MAIAVSYPAYLKILFEISIAKFRESP